MRVKGWGRLVRWKNWLCVYTQARALILLYHRVTELPKDPQLLSVSPRHFAEQLQVIRQYFYPISLQELVKRVRQGQVPHRAVALTFDDGYADNLYQAKPLLEKHDVPATVFVTTGYIGQRREFWWDELERVFLEPRMLPRVLQLKVRGTALQWTLGEASLYTQEEFQRHRGWSVLEQHNPTPRHCTYRELHQVLRTLPQEEQERAVNEILAWAGTTPIGRPTHRTLSPDEVVRLADGGLVEVGAHSVTHPVLSVLSVERQHIEINESKRHLEEILGCAVTSFSYPYGTRSDFNSTTIQLVREAGFLCACANFSGLVVRGSDLFQLPRLLVRDWDGEEFMRRLGDWLGG